MALFPVLPTMMVNEVGLATSEKLGAGSGQLFTRFAALRVPMPVAKSQPVVVPKAGWYAVLEVESTPSMPFGNVPLVSKQFTLVLLQGRSISPSVTS